MNLNIITAYYNKSKYLPRFLESLKAQKNKNFKLIIVNDCSSPKETQNLNAIVNLYANDLNITVIGNVHNSGLMASRKAGFDYIKKSLNPDNDIVSFCDPDDGVSVYYVNDILNFFGNSNNTQDIFVFNILGYTTHNQDKSMDWYDCTDIPNFDKYTDYYKLVNEGYNNGNHFCNKAFRFNFIAELFWKFRYPLSMYCNLLEDFIYTCAIAYMTNATYHYTERCLYYYDMTTEGIMNEVFTKGDSAKSEQEQNFISVFNAMMLVAPRMREDFVNGNGVFKRFLFNTMNFVDTLPPPLAKFVISNFDSVEDNKYDVLKHWDWNIEYNALQTRVVHRYFGLTGFGLPESRDTDDEEYLVDQIAKGYIISDCGCNEATNRLGLCDAIQK